MVIRNKHSLAGLDLEEKTVSGFPGEERLANSGLDLLTLRKVINSVIVERLPSQFVASSVRANSFSEWKGGLKSELVGRLELSVATGLKLGGTELHRDMKIMQAINQAGKSVCVEPLTITQIDGKNYVLLMEALEKHISILELIYKHPVTRRVQRRLLEKVVVGLTQVRKATSFISPNLGVVENLDPYSNRLRSKIVNTYRKHESLNALGVLTSPGLVGGVSCPPIEELVEEACAWLDNHPVDDRLVLAHGDLHLKNILVRRRGKGYSFRFIDPNGNIGLTDPLYDYGKLLHWAEELGWSQIDSSACQVSHNQMSGKMNWSLQAKVSPVSKAAETRREFLEEQLVGQANSYCQNNEDMARLYISIASAHAGLFYLYAENHLYDLAHFSAFYTLRALLRWRDLLE